MSEYSERVRQSVLNRQREFLHSGVEVSDAQISLVMRSLADHTLIQQGLNFHVDEKSPWTRATSLGRFFHHLADEFEKPQPDHVQPITFEQMNACMEMLRRFAESDGRVHAADVVVEMAKVLKDGVTE